MRILCIINIARTVHTYRCDVDLLYNNPRAYLHVSNSTNEIEVDVGRTKSYSFDRTFKSKVVFLP